RVPDSRLAALRTPPQPDDVAHGQPPNALRRIGAEPAGAEQAGKTRRHHAVGRGYTRIAPAQVGNHDCQAGKMFRVDGARVEPGLPGAQRACIKHSCGTSASGTAPRSSRYPFGVGISRGSMTILVTGGGDYIGSHMAHALVDAGEPVVVVDNLTTGFRAALPESATLVIGDVGDQALLTSVIKTHAVSEIIHFAASIVVPDSVC